MAVLSRAALAALITEKVRRHQRRSAESPEVSERDLRLSLRDLRDVLTDFLDSAALGSEVSGGVDTANGPLAGEFARFVDADTIEGLTEAELKVAANLEIGVDVQAHSAVLDATTASFLTADETKLDGIEAGATADQTNAEIETAYNAQVAAASQAEMEAGTETAIRRMTPQRVAQAIAALAGGGGAWAFIGSASGAGGTVDFTDIDATYIVYMFVLTGIDLSADADLELLTDANNGASYDAGASDYGWATHADAAAANFFTDSADTEISLFGTALGGAANELINGIVYLFNPAGTDHTGFTWHLQAANTTGVPTLVYGAGKRLSAAAVNAVRFQASTGNIAGGTIRLYGLVPS